MTRNPDTCDDTKHAIERGGRKAGGMGMRSTLRAVLASPDFEEVLLKLDFSPRKLIGPLLSYLCETDEIVRWRAIRAIGMVVSLMAGESAESARNVMRRLMWSLNDESGGIGWGAPEAMGEIMASDEKLALEYHCILLSYVDECGNLLEHDQLERGVLWGIGRLAGVRPELVRGSVAVIVKQLDSHDAVKKGLALWVLSILGYDCDPGRERIESLREDETEIRIFQEGEFGSFRVGDLADKVLAGCR